MGRVKSSSNQELLKKYCEINNETTICLICLKVNKKTKEQSTKKTPKGLYHNIYSHLKAHSNEDKIEYDQLKSESEKLCDTNSIFNEIICNHQVLFNNEFIKNNQQQLLIIQDSIVNYLRKQAETIDYCTLTCEEVNDSRTSEIYVNLSLCFIDNQFEFKKMFLKTIKFDKHLIDIVEVIVFLKRSI